MANYAGLRELSTTTVTGSNVRVRAYPRTGETFYQAQRGNTVKILEKEIFPTDNYTWYYIKNESQSTMKKGWIRGDYLSGASATDPDNYATATINSSVWEQILNGSGSLRKGANNDTTAVKKLQLFLRKIGYGALNTGALYIDGDFGDATEKAVKSFQREFVDLNSDGVVGQNTAESLQTAQTNQWFTTRNYFPLQASFMTFNAYPFNDDNDKSIIMRAIAGEHGYPANNNIGHQNARAGVAKVLMNRTNPNNHCGVAVSGDYSYKSVYLNDDYTSHYSTYALTLPRGCPEIMDQLSNLADDLIDGVWPTGAPAVTPSHIYQKGSAAYHPEEYEYFDLVFYPNSTAPFSFFYTGYRAK